jgi:hypothetical protein
MLRMHKRSRNIPMQLVKVDRCNAKIQRRRSMVQNGKNQARRRHSFESGRTPTDLWGTKMKLEQEQDDKVGVCVFLMEVMRSNGSEQGKIYRYIMYHN